jgi:hypothetical protein
MDRTSPLQTSILIRVPRAAEVAALVLAEGELTVSTPRIRRKSKTDHCGAMQCETKSSRK